DVGVALMESGPLPRLWTVPMGARGAFLLTVDTEFMGDASVWLAEAGAARSGPYSYFLMDSAFTRAGLLRLDSLGVDQGLHWDRTISSWRPVRFLRFRLYRRQRAADEQLLSLESRGFVPGPFGLTNRNHFLAMRDPAEHFRQVAALGVRIDSSWGPDTTCYGYPYATGYPYYPVDRNGLPFGLLELPFQYADYYGGVDSAAVQRLIRGCAEESHGVLVALYHPSFLRGRGTVECYATWRRVSTWARAAGLWMG